MADALERYKGVVGVVGFFGVNKEPSVLGGLFTLEHFLELMERFYEHEAEEERVRIIKLVQAWGELKKMPPTARQVCDQFFWVPIQDYVQLENGNPVVINWKHEQDG